LNFHNNIHLQNYLYLVLRRKKNHAWSNYINQPTKRDQNQSVRVWRERVTNIYIFVRLGGVIVFNATFNNISAISLRSVLLVEETVVSGENHRSVASHLQTLSHTVVLSTPRNERDSNSQL